MNNNNNNKVSPSDAAVYPPPGTAHPSHFNFIPDNDPNGANGANGANDAVADSSASSKIACLAAVQGTLVRGLHQVTQDGALVPWFDATVSDASQGATSEADLSEAEKLRRERSRTLALGVFAYHVSSEDGTVLLPFFDRVVVQPQGYGPQRELVSLAQLQAAESPAGDSIIDARLVPAGRGVSFVFDDEVYVVDFEAKDAGAGQGQCLARRVTWGARGTTAVHGTADYIAQEELDRYEGYWFSPDGLVLAFTAADDSNVPRYQIVRQGDDVLSTESHAYAFAGADDASVRLGFVRVEDGAASAEAFEQSVVWVSLALEACDVDGAAGPETPTYLARAVWDPADGSLLVQIVDRLQTTLQLLRIDPASGARTLLYTYATPVWANVHNAFASLADGGFVFATEESGFLHLSRFDASGSRLNPITSGEWVVSKLLAVDEPRGLVFFESTIASAAETHVCVARLDGSTAADVTVLTAAEPGVHAAKLAPDALRLVDVYSSVATPPRVTVYDITIADDGTVAMAPGPEGVVFDAAVADVRYKSLASAMVTPELSTFTASDGTMLHAMVFKPDPAIHGDGPYPTVVHVYGGPHVQYVLDSWARGSANMQDQMLVSAGYVVARFDGRGSARRGLAFEGAIKHNMGDLEIADQADGAAWLIDQGLADPQRIGIFGWSYGGYATLMALARQSHIFKVGVSGAPVTDWKLYDTAYTHRYMGTPQDNPDGYTAASVLTHVGNIPDSSSVLVIHGLIDENVLFRNTALLIEQFIKHGKHHELLLLPTERHGPRNTASREHVAKSILRFFNTHLAQQSS